MYELPDYTNMTPDQKLDAILREVRRTNGRVTRLEEEVYGSEVTKTRGLIVEVQQIKTAVFDTRAVARALRWIIPLAVGATGVIASLV